LPASPVKELTGRAGVRAAHNLDLREDIEDFQKDIALYIRLKDQTTDSADKDFLTGLIMDTITLISHYHQEIKES
jgi:hypothetical protein